MGRVRQNLNELIRNRTSDFDAELTESDNSQTDAVAEVSSSGGSSNKSLYESERKKSSKTHFKIERQELEITHLRDVISKQGDLLSFQLNVLTNMRESTRQSMISCSQDPSDETEILKRTMFDLNVRLQESLRAFSDGLKEVDEAYTENATQIDALQLQKSNVTGSRKSTASAALEAECNPVAHNISLTRQRSLAVESSSQSDSSALHNVKKAHSFSRNSTVELIDELLDRIGKESDVHHNAMKKLDSLGSGAESDDAVLLSKEDTNLEK